jgi:hypothetical protein
MKLGLQFNAVQMMAQSIDVLVAHLRDVQAGKAKRDIHLLRSINSFCSKIPLFSQAQLESTHHEVCTRHTDE